MRIRSHDPALLALHLSTFAVRSVFRSERIVASIKPIIAQNEVSGAVRMVSKGGQIASFNATGVAGTLEKTAMKKDSLFRIASMTKPFTEGVFMMVQRRGFPNGDNSSDRKAFQTAAVET